MNLNVWKNEYRGCGEGFVGAHTLHLPCFLITLHKAGGAQENARKLPEVHFQAISLACFMKFV